MSFPYTFEVIFSFERLKISLKSEGSIGNKSVQAGPLPSG